MADDDLYDWYTEEIGSETHSITATFNEWISIYASLKAALGNPRLAKRPREITTKTIAQLEEMFKAMGMTKACLAHTKWVAIGGITEIYDAVSLMHAQATARRITDEGN